MTYFIGHLFNKFFMVHRSTNHNIEVCRSFSHEIIDSFVSVFSFEKQHNYFIEFISQYNLIESQHKKFVVLLSLKKKLFYWFYPTVCTTLTEHYSTLSSKKSKIIFVYYGKHRVNITCSFQYPRPYTKILPSTDQ